jgi:hypothetical protein
MIGGKSDDSLGVSGIIIGLFGEVSNFLGVCFAEETVNMLISGFSSCGLSSYNCYISIMFVTKAFHKSIN